MKKRFSVKGMSCAACQAHVNKAVSNVNGVISCNVNLLSNSMDVEWDESITDPKTIEKAVSEAGYSASLSKDKTIKQDIAFYKLLISLFLMIILMYISMGHMWGWPIPTFMDPQKTEMKGAIWFCLAQLLLTTPIVVLYFKQYFVDGFKKLIKLQPNMNSLISVGALASLIYGLVETVLVGYYTIVLINSSDSTQVSMAFGKIEALHMNLYYESAAMIISLVSLGKYLESLSKKKTTKAIEQLMELAPQEALVVKDGNETIIPIQDVAVGDIIVCRKGDRVPVDGTIIEGTATFDESSITGESIPVQKTKETSIYSSTIINSGFVKFRADKVGDDTSINTIIRLVEEAANSKAPISKLVDKVSLYFVPSIFGISLLTLIAWLIISKDFSISFNYAITVLVIACPCALGLATPVAIMVGSGKGAQHGLLIKNAEILEKVHSINTVVFDKTGTITEGRPTVTDYLVVGDDCYSEIVAIEEMSEHPLSSAIIDYKKNLNKEIKVDSFEAIDGIGISAKINQNVYAIGNEKVLNDNESYEKWLQKAHNLALEGKTVLFVVRDSELMSIIAVKDVVKSSSVKAIGELKKLGISTVMLTGDNETTAQAIADEVGISRVISQVLPDEKSFFINKLKNDNGLVAMVGDGVNDAIALTSADVGIAIGAGSDVALDSADIVLLHNDLLDVSNAISLSKATLRTIKIGLFWAFFYNCICVLIATGAFSSFGLTINPMIGSAAMSLSSVFVVCNALILNLWKPNQNASIKKEVKQPMDNKVMFKVEGMMCKHCVAHVTNSINEVPGVKTVEVSLEKGTAIVTGSFSNDDVINAVKKGDYGCSVLQ